MKYGAKFKSKDICQCSDHDAQTVFKQGEKFANVSDNSISKICYEYFKDDRNDETIGYLVKKSA